MTDLAALTARAELLEAEEYHGPPMVLIRDLLTYATTVTKERDEQHEAAQLIMSDLRCELEMEKAERATVTQERDRAQQALERANQRAVLGYFWPD